MGAKRLHSLVLLCGKSTSKNTVFPPLKCVCFRLLSLSLSLSLSHSFTRSVQKYTKSEKNSFLFLQQDAAYINIRGQTRSIKHVSESELTLCGCESCLLFLCAHSRGWLPQIVTPSPQAPSASAWQKQEKNTMNSAHGVLRDERLINSSNIASDAKGHFI